MRKDRTQNERPQQGIVVSCDHWVPHKLEVLHVLSSSPHPRRKCRATTAETAVLELRRKAARVSHHFSQRPVLFVLSPHPCHPPRHADLIVEADNRSHQQTPQRSRAAPSYASLNRPARGFQDSPRDKLRAVRHAPLPPQGKTALARPNSPNRAPSRHER